MRITVESIDPNAMVRLGFAQLPSFPVQFSSVTVCGTANFVPAIGDAQSCAGQVFDVEINQQKITNLERIGAESGESVVACVELGCYKVAGRVTSVVRLDERGDDEIVTVTAGEATFTLSSGDVAGIALSLGQSVSFLAHSLSLWDEAT